MLRTLAPLWLTASLAALALAGCATTASLPPTEVVRYHLGDQIARGTIAVQPLSGTPSLEFQNYAGAIQAELARIGYTPAAPGALPDFVAITEFHAIPQVGPPRRSPFSVGVGAGGYSGGGGYRGGGGVGLGGGVSFPIGGARRDAVLASDLEITIKRRADQSAVWEGKARGVVDARKPDATPPAQAGRLAAAMFTGFPGESGRTIEVR